MSEPRRLVAVPPPAPDPDIVRACRDALALAEAGQVLGIAAVVLRRDGDVVTAVMGADGCRVVEMLGGVELLRLKAAAVCLEEA